MARISHQQFRTILQDDLRALQSPLESGTFLQDFEAELKNKKYLRNLGKCGEIADSGRVVCLSTRADFEVHDEVPYLDHRRDGCR